MQVYPSSEEERRYFAERPAQPSRGQKYGGVQKPCLVRLADFYRPGSELWAETKTSTDIGESMFS